MGKFREYSKFFQSYNPSGGGKEEWNMWCQAFVARCSKALGSHKRDYLTARAARLASGPLKRDSPKAPLGAIGYWLWEPDDHVAIHIGNGVWMMGSRHVTIPFGGVALHAGLATFDHFQASATLQFLGWSATNGGNVIPIEPDLEGNQRLVASATVPANGRSRPSTQGTTVNSIIAGGDLGNFDGWVHGETVTGSDIWFRGMYSKNWWHCSSFTDRGTHNLADLN